MLCENARSERSFPVPVQSCDASEADHQFTVWTDDTSDQYFLCSACARRAGQELYDTDKPYHYTRFRDGDGDDPDGDLPCDNRREILRANRPLIDMDPCSGRPALYAVTIIAGKTGNCVVLCKQCERRYRDKLRYRDARMNTRLLPRVR